ncbi:MAG: PHP domain-containing protein [Caldilineae bacterium]|nr:MAG: PHP domain-containing protein [Caldilineae bacterium]
MGTADLHIHTIYSDGTATPRAVLHHVSTYTDLDVIAITDHDTLRGALEALEAAPAYRVRVVPGMEISTREGHLLALFLETPVKPGLSFVETAQQVRLFGGLPFAAHPMAPLATSIGGRRLRQICRRHPGLLGGIEAFNGSSLLGERDNARAQNMRWELALVGIGCSDAHVLEQIGHGRTAFPGRGVEDLRQALESGAAVPLPSPRADQHYRRHALRFLLRFGLGVVSTLEGGEDGGGRIRLRRWRR